jgi:hypothetical protein
MYIKSLIIIMVLLSIAGCAKKEVTTQHSKPAVVSTSERKTTGEGDRTPPIQNRPGITAKQEPFKPNLSISNNNEKVDFTFTLKNQMGHLFTFHFNTMQKYEFIIRDGNGKIIKQLSKEKTILKLPSSEPLKPDASLIFKESVGPLPKGTYYATFVLLAKELQPKVSVKFEVN